LHFFHILQVCPIFLLYIAGLLCSYDHQGAALVKGCTGAEKHSVYIRLLSDLSPGSVTAKIAGELKNRTGEGHFICYFEVSGMLCRWSYEELRTIIGTGQKKSPGPA
jgi:hypothetical protein